MEAFVRTTGVAAALMRNNVDTDQIAPGMYPANTPKEKHAAALFKNLRYLPDQSPNPEFVLNRAPWTGAEILVAGENFGCGSSREAAAKSLRAFGFRAIIAQSFGGILFNNCYRNGILPVVLPKPAVDRLALDAEHAAQGARITVDLEAMTVSDSDGNSYGFTAPVQQREMLLKGLDEIAFTLGMRDQIDGFRARDRVARPWVYQPVDRLR